MGRFEGRVVAVTGAGQGLGRAHALAYAAQGAKVVVNDLRDAKLVADEIVALGGEAIAVDASVGDMSAGKEIVSAAVDGFGRLDVVVNNAGFIRDALILNLTEEDFDSVLNVHLKGTFSLTQAAAAYWREQSKAGDASRRAIVNTSSGAGLHGNVGQLNYSAAKAGIAMMTVNSALELKRYGVSVNCIAPAARTAPVEATPGMAEIVGAPEDPTVFDKFDPANISPLVLFLSTEDCPFTGQVFSVFGGHVGLYAGWSIAHEVESDRQWTVETLSAALAELPPKVKVNRQRIAGGA
jgi:NAD(P)-dependent dehydrogenase (short-subunit alcohol dehydrogenase family)